MGKMFLKYQQTCLHDHKNPFDFRSYQIMIVCSAKASLDNFRYLCYIVSSCVGEQQNNLKK